MHKSTGDEEGSASGEEKKKEMRLSDGSGGDGAAHDIVHDAGSAQHASAMQRVISAALEEEPDTRAIGSYRLGDRIGKGGYSEVYKALDTDTGDFVAIKRIPVGRVKTRELLQLLQEGHLMEQLEHEHIVSFYGAVETRNHINLILEYVDSGSLGDLVQKYGVLSETLTAGYLEQILAGLLYLHGHGVVHRDIKSHNILLTNEGVVKLADFGIAHLYSADAAARSLSTNTIGSPYWMSPEVIQLIDASPASDIWSVGCTVIELVTGKPPYYDMSKTAACFRMVEDKHPPLPESAGEGLQAFLLRCFVKDPHQRATADQLLRDGWLVGRLDVLEKKRSRMKKSTSITTLPRFRVDSNSKAGKAVEKSISSSTLPRYRTSKNSDDDSSRGGDLQAVFSAGGAPGHYMSLRGRRRAAGGSMREKRTARRQLSAHAGEAELTDAKQKAYSDKRSISVGNIGRGSLRERRRDRRHTPPPSTPSASAASSPASEGSSPPNVERDNSWSKSKTHCFQCHEKVGFFKHHCSKCEQIFCGHCLSKKLKVPSVKGQVRLCGGCLTQLMPSIKGKKRDDVEVI